MRFTVFLLLFAFLFLTFENGYETRDLYRRPSMPWVWTCPGCPPPYFPDDVPQMRGSRQLSNKVQKRAFEPWFLAPSSNQYPYDTPL